MSCLPQFTVILFFYNANTCHVHNNVVLWSPYCLLLQCLNMSCLPQCSLTVTILSSFTMQRHVMFTTMQSYGHHTAFFYSAKTCHVYTMQSYSHHAVFFYNAKTCHVYHNAVLRSPYCLLLQCIDMSCLPQCSLAVTILHSFTVQKHVMFNTIQSTSHHTVFFYNAKTCHVYHNVVL